MDGGDLILICTNLIVTGTFDSGRKCSEVLNIVAELTNEARLLLLDRLVGAPPEEKMSKMDPLLDLGFLIGDWLELAAGSKSVEDLRKKSMKEPRRDDAEGKGGALSSSVEVLAELVRLTAPRDNSGSGSAVLGRKKSTNDARLFCFILCPIIPFGATDAPVVSMVGAVAEGELTDAS